MVKAVSFIGGICIALVLFWVLQRTISAEGYGAISQSNSLVVDFVRVKHETKLRKKERLKPQKPIKPKLHITAMSLDDRPKAVMNDQPLRIKLPKFNFTNALFDPILDPLLVGLGEINRDLVPVVYFRPQYPYRALRARKEGMVELEFTITETGTVKDIDVVKAQPKDLFETSAISAVSRWRFKPKLIDGQAVPQRAVQVINFFLDKA